MPLDDMLILAALEKIVTETFGKGGAVLVTCGNPMTCPDIHSVGLSADEARELIDRAGLRMSEAPVVYPQQTEN